MGVAQGPVALLLLAAGAAWESEVLRTLSGSRAAVVLKRCVDVADLLATASTGQADVAVVAAEAPGLDHAALAHLRRYDVRSVAVCDDTDTGRLERLGVDRVVASDMLVDQGSDLVPTLTSLANEPVDGLPPDEETSPQLSTPAHRVLAVWGPTGAPGRTTVAVGVAAELAGRGRTSVLVDADPFGGAVAQHLGVLDEVSGMLTACRAANAGELDRRRLAAALRSLSPHLNVLTGLPRAERWVEVRPDHLREVLDLAREGADVVVDTGFCLEQEATGFGAAPERHTMTLTAIEAADEILVVGSADPVGLARLARGLVELNELLQGSGAVPRVRVVVNRMRGSLGWAPREITAMVEGYVQPRGVHFVPEDRAGTDRALVAGRSLVESGDGPARRALAELVDALDPGEAPRRGGRRRWRRRKPQAPNSR